MIGGDSGGWVGGGAAGGDSGLDAGGDDDFGSAREKVRGGLLDFVVLGFFCLLGHFNLFIYMAFMAV